MSSAGRQVPWASWQEWSQVAAWLDADEPAAVQKGLNRVATWRCRGRVPLGADIHACLTEIQLRDPCPAGRRRLSAGTSPTDDGALRLQYAMAIVRLVNGVADAAQKGRTAVSVAGLAAQAGLPQVLVDLRHEATHSELPSLPLLRLAACQALAWLRACYWQAQSDQLAASEARYRHLLQELLSSSDPALAGACQPFSSPPALQASAAVQKQQRAIMAELRSLVPAAAAALLAAPLLEAGFLRLPTAEAAEAAADTPNSGLAMGEASSQLRAWQACMAMLQQEYPSLPGLLLAGAVANLAAAQPSVAAQSMAWVRLLLQQGTSEDGSSAALRKRHSNGSTSRGQNDAAFAWQPTQAQVLQTAAICIAAQQGFEAAESAQGAEQPAAVLLDAAHVLLQHVDGQLPCSAARTVAATSALQDAEQQQAQVLSSAAACERGTPVATRHRWKRVDHWLPCAIGGLQSAHDPNGMSAPLPRQRGASSTALAASTPAEDMQQATAAERNPDYFAKFGDGQSVDAAAADYGQQQPVVSQLSEITPARVLVW